MIRWVLRRVIDEFAIAPACRRPGRGVGLAAPVAAQVSASRPPPLFTA